MPCFGKRQPLFSPATSRRHITAPPHQFQEEPNVPSPHLRASPLCPPAPPSLTRPWRSPCKHPAPLETSPDGSGPISPPLRASPTGKLSSRPHAPLLPRTPPQHRRPQPPPLAETFGPTALRPQTQGPCIQAAGFHHHQALFPRFPGPKLPRLPEVACAALIHVEPSPIPGTLAPSSPHPRTSSPARGL